MNGGHLKLGLFVIVATTLLAVMLLLLGALDRFRPSVPVTTYFTEPIVGLQTGAAVRYRGVGIGTVGAIELVEPTELGATGDSDIIGAMIRVRLDLDPRAVAVVRDPEFPAMVETAIRRGMRTRMTSSGLGGPTYIELDYVTPGRAGTAELPSSDGIVIPSTTSTMRTLAIGLETALADINESGVINHVSTLAEVAPELESLLRELRDSNLIATANASMEGLESLTTEMNTLVGDERLGRLLDDTSTTLEDVRSFADRGRGDLDEITPKVVAMADALEAAASAADALVVTVNDSELVPELRAAAGELGPAGRELTAMANRLDHLIAANDAELAETIRALRRAVERLDAFLEEAEANPSRILFGDPPPRRPVGDGP